MLRGSRVWPTDIDQAPQRTDYYYYYYYYCREPGERKRGVQSPSRRSAR